MTLLLILSSLSVNKAFAEEKEEEHKIYIEGYKDNTLRPENNITREEAVVILDRISENHKMTKRRYIYNDVDEKRWSHKYIENLSNKGVVEGDHDNNFGPEDKITRAEAAAMIVRLENPEIKDNLKISDEIKDHWAKDYIASAMDKNWLKGYEDKSIKPDNNITRAEFIAMVNRVKDRKVDSENILQGIKEFKDLNKNAWWYEDVVEASNSHKFENKRLEDGSEKWTRVIK